MAAELNRDPSPSLRSYVCPHCEVFAEQNPKDMFVRSGTGGFAMLAGWQRDTCNACNGITVWFEAKMVVPPGAKIGPHPSVDMPEGVQAVFNEARDVGRASLRAGAALLRLALQLLIDELEPGSGNLNTKIGRLVQRGLDPLVQQAMDATRIIGNSAVHPGQIEGSVDPETVGFLFSVINLIVEQMITRPVSIQRVFDSLPAAAREQIDRRDRPGY